MPLLSTLGTLNATGFGFSSVGKIPSVAIRTSFSPFLSAYPFNTTNGFGTKYADPSTLSGTGVGKLINQMSFNSDASLVYNASDATPYISIYPWNNGFGTKYANLETPISNSGACFSFNNLSICFITPTISAPNIRAYNWSKSSGFGAQYTDPSTGVGSTNLNIANDNTLFTGSTLSQTNFTNAFPFDSSTGFGTMYTAMAQFGRVSGIGINPTSTTVVFSQQTGTNFMSCWNWISGTGWGTRYTAPASLPAAATVQGKFSPKGNVVGVLAVAGSFVYPWTDASGFGTRYSGLPAALTSWGISYQEDAIATGTATSPYLTIYNWSNALGIGTAFSSPVILPPSEILGISFTPY